MRRSRPQPLRQRPHRPSRELSTRSELFRKRWPTTTSAATAPGAKKLHHPVVGDLELHFEAMPLTSGPGLTLTICTAIPNTPSADALRLLATWTPLKINPTTTTMYGRAGINPSPTTWPCA